MFSADSGQGEPTDITDDNILYAIPTFDHHFVLSTPTDTGDYRLSKGFTQTDTPKHATNSVIVRWGCLVVFLSELQISLVDPEGGPWTPLLKFAFCRFVSVSFSFSHRRCYNEIQTLAEWNDRSTKSLPFVLADQYACITCI